MQQAMTMIGQPGAPQGMTTQPPPMLAQQAQAALPAGAPGQVAATAEAAPPEIGAAPFSYFAGAPGATRPAGAASMQYSPTTLSEGGQRMTPDAQEMTPIRGAQPPQFDEQGKPIAPQPQLDLRSEERRVGKECRL